MKCATCHANMISKKGEFDLRIKGRLYLVRNTSYQECPSCGEKVLSPDVSQRLYEKIQNGQFKKENISISVLDGAYS